MGASAESKFEKADRLHGMAQKVKKHDPEAAVKMESLAKRTRASAIRQMSRRPKRRKGSAVL